MQDDNDYLDTKIGRFNKDPSVTTLYIGNLPFDFNELDIQDLFDPIGYTNYIKLIKDPVTHNSRGIAFVQMAHRTQAMKAIKELNDKDIEGRTLKVSIAKEEPGSDRFIKKKRRKPYKPYIAKADRKNETNE